VLRPGAVAAHNRTVFPDKADLEDNDRLAFFFACNRKVQMENYYATLGVAPNASDDEIKKIYRSLAMRYHPDRNSAPGAEARFKAVSKAYEILSDPVKREEYNQSVNHRIVLDAEAEAYELWRQVFSLNGVALAA